MMAVELCQTFFLANDLICIMSHTKRLRDLKKKYQEQGENCITRLYFILYNAGREEDIKRTFTDRSFRDRLLVLNATEGFSTQYKTHFLQYKTHFILYTL